MKVVIDEDMSEHVISKHIYGHFAEHLGRCVYEGLWVGEDSSIPNTRGIRTDVVRALRKLAIPNLRWPGGCYADEYHWKDGIGAKETRRKIVNTHWGGEAESNHFGTHEFMDLCQQLECKPYVCGNVGSGTIREMQDWIEYLTFGGLSPMTDLRSENGREAPWKLEYFGVGNESWGCGGNMRAEYYADEYRRYQTYIRNFAESKIYKIACGPVNDDFHWTETLMCSAARFMSGLSFHYYVTMPGTTATEFDEEGWFETFDKAFLMDTLITRHSAIMNRYDPEKKVGLIVDEWGTWYDADSGTNPAHLYQQNTLRDALVAGVTLNIFNSHCDRVHMANIAQAVNVLQAMILTDREKMLLTPSYHVFEMYQGHQGAHLLPLYISESAPLSDKGQFPLVSMSASRAQTGRLQLSLCNLHPSEPQEVVCELRGGAARTAVLGRVLTDAAMNAHNTFEQPERIKPEAFTDMSLNQNVVTLKLPPKSVTTVEIYG